MNLLRHVPPRVMAKRLAIGALVVALLALSLIGVLTITRGTPVRQVVSVSRTGSMPAVTDSLFVRTFELYTGTVMEQGNVVQVLSNGDESYPPLWRDLRSARQSITVQMYFSKPGAVADTMRAVLAERAHAGVRVLLLLDAFGSQELQGDWERPLRAAGVEVAWLREPKWYSLHKAGMRSHARAVVIDGHIGYTGGFGLADYWLGNGLEPEQWREANARFEGPAVAQLQAAFATGWAEAAGELLTGDIFYPRAGVAPAGTSRAALLHTIPTVGSTAAERFLALTLAGATRTLWIANSYFVPDDDFRGLLLAARKRGVDVRILVPGEMTDVKSTLYAGRARYEELLEGGIRIWEYQPTMMHAKTIVADGAWATVGSLNFDNRSMAFNNETTVVVLDSAVGRVMDSLFVADLRHSKEITLAEFRRRPWTGRVMEWGANLLSRLL